MSEPVTIWGFGDNDRSGKVRWIAAELGLAVEEQRVEPGAHRKPPYLEMNPFGQIPTAKFRGQIYVESTATCHVLAEALDQPKLWIGPREPNRDKYLFWLAVFGETLEGRLVECAVSRIGVLGPEYFTLHEKRVRSKLSVAAKLLPKEGFLCGDRFTVADVLAGYNLRLAVQTGLTERSAIEPYFSRLVNREGARTSRIFSSLEV